MSWRRLPRSLSAFVLLLAVVGCSAPDLEVRDARVRALVPGTDKTVGYFRLVNRTEDVLTFTGAKSVSARAIELHTTTADESGIMRMRRLANLRVAPGETLDFAPGGHHLMLFGVAGLGDRVAGPGDRVEISLQFEERDPLLVSFRVVGLLD